MDLFKCKKTDTLFHAMSKINQNAHGFVCLVDDSDKLEGVLTDGDARRAILEGANLSDLAIKHANTSPQTALHTDDLEKARMELNSRIRFIPVVDDHHRLAMILSHDTTSFTPIATPRYLGNEVSYAIDAILSTWISSKGHYIDKFETMFAEFCGVKHAISVSNGTVAIQLALTGLGIGPGDEVIVPNFTFAATINTVIHVGATPVIVDIDESWTINPEKIRAAITEKTKAIIPVHLYGQPADMRALCSLAKEHNLFVIEDCAEAHGALVDGAMVGNIGDCGAFSFFANKIITTGEGGMVTTNDTALYTKLKQLRDHGMSPEKKYWHDYVGFNFRMTNIQAAIGCGQLEQVNYILKRREDLEDYFRDELSQNEFVDIQAYQYEGRKKVNWLTSFTLKNDFAHQRDELLSYLYSKGIEARPFFFPLSEMPIYKKYVRSENLEKSYEVSRSGFSLPTDIKLEREDVKRFCQEIVNFFSTGGKNE